MVKINLDGLKGEALTKAATKSEQIIATTEANASSSISNSTGFLNLPAELRNDIYRMVHVSANSISLPFYPAANRKQLQLSSAFLATCRQVHTVSVTIRSTTSFVYDLPVGLDDRVGVVFDLHLKLQHPPKLYLR